MLFGLSIWSNQFFLFRNISNDPFLLQRLMVFHHICFQCSSLDFWLTFERCRYFLVEFKIGKFNHLKIHSIWFIKIYQIWLHQSANPGLYCLRYVSFEINQLVLFTANGNALHKIFINNTKFKLPKTTSSWFCTCLTKK